MSANPQSGSYRLQDGQVLDAPGPDKRPHAEYRWDERIGASEWTVRAAWRAGDAIAWPGEGYARYHHPTDTVIVAAWGFLQTVIRADAADRPATQAALERSGVRDE